MHLELRKNLGILVDWRNGGVQIAFDFNGLTFLTTGFLLLSNHADSAIEGETAGITKGQRCAFTIARLGYGRSMGLKTVIPETRSKSESLLAGGPGRARASPRPAANR